MKISTVVKQIADQNNKTLRSIANDNDIPYKTFYHRITYCNPSVRVLLSVLDVLNCKLVVEHKGERYEIEQ